MCRICKGGNPLCSAKFCFAAKKSDRLSGRIGRQDENGISGKISRTQVPSPGVLSIVSTCKLWNIR